MEEENLLKIVGKQRNFFSSQQTKALTFREYQLTQLYEMIKKYEKKLCEALEHDIGKHPSESYMTEIGMAYHSIRLMKKNLGKWAKKRKKKTPLFLFPAKSYTVPSPYGCTLIMSAFNYPVLLSLDPLIGAIAGGNTALIALSEHTPAVNEVLMEARAEFFSEEYLYFFVSSIEKNQSLLQERFDKIFFTGSSRVGKIVLAAASQHLTPVTLELGGKSPAIVMEDADISLAAQRIVWGKLINAGATCVAPDYVLVSEAVALPFIEKVKEGIINLYGPNCQKQKDYPRIVNKKEHARLVRLLEKDKEYIISGGNWNENDLYIEPTVLKSDLTTQLATMEEEIFGPILPILIYQSEKEAKDFIRKFEAPLAFYPFTKSASKSNQWLQEMQFGGATINDTILHLTNPYLPFGGVGYSGMGHYHGKYSFETFTHEKAVLERKNYLNLPIMYPPYSEKKDTIIRKFMR